VIEPGDDRRTEARERALGLLYEADAKTIPVLLVLQAQPVAPDPLAVLLAEGVGDRTNEIDTLISRYLRGWTIERLPVLDRLVLSIATFELLARDDTPTAVIIDEAVELAKRYSTDESPGFVNGVLSSIAADVRG
jgi:N utilization substance protein B